MRRSFGFVTCPRPVSAETARQGQTSTGLPCYSSSSPCTFRVTYQVASLISLKVHQQKL